MTYIFECLSLNTNSDNANLNDVMYSLEFRVIHSSDNVRTVSKSFVIVDSGIVANSSI